MNVLIVVPWDQKRGGVASVVGNLGKYLEARGHGVFFFHPDPQAIFLAEGKTKWEFQDFRLRLSLPFGDNHPVLGTLAFFALFPLAMYQLIRLIRRHRIDIVNIHYPLDSFAYFALCRSFLPIKLVTSIHGADIFPKGKPRAAYPAPLRFLLRSSDIIVANSRAFREDFLALFPGLKEKTIAIHNGVDLAELNGPASKASAKNGRRYLLSIATHNEKKGLDVLIRAFAHVARLDPNLDLFLVGDGPLRSQLEELARSLSLEARVRFLGSRDRPEIATLLHGCELFVLPSKSEPFGIVILEALACRKPVVATKTGGIPEIIQSGVNGILVEPERPGELAHAISTVLTDQNLRRNISERGYATAERQFRCENTGKAYEAAFSGLALNACRR